jgi:hypothetical protein
MARVLSNNVSLRYVVETSLGVAPTSGWVLTEPNGISTYGEEQTTVARRPISAIRGRKKGTVTDAVSNVEFEADLTMSSFDDFIEGFVFSEFANVEFDLTDAKANGAALDATGTGYDFAGAVSTFTNATEVAAKMIWVTGAAQTLIYGSGYLLDANNGLKVLTADVASGSTAIVCAGTATETAPANAKVEVAGVAVDDLTLTISGSTATLVSAADVADWSVHGLNAGQFIHIGGTTSAGVNANLIATDVYGYARITSISGATLNLDKLDAKLGAAGPHAPAARTDILFGRFLRNVAVTASANDARYIERTYQFEAVYPDLGGVGTDEYEYAKGNTANEIALSLPLSDKAMATWTFLGTETGDITASRTTGPSTALDPLKTTAVSTSSDIASITTDVISLASDVCFKDLTVTINNNATPEKCLGSRAADFVNVGLFEVSIEGQMLFTNKSIVDAVKNNTTVTFTSIFKNDNGAVALDLPALTFGGGAREFPVDASVLVSVEGQTFTDPTLGYDLGVSLFPTVPTVRS